MKSILAFGDSNTWGFIPNSQTLVRYPAEIRWTGVLQAKCDANRTGLRIIEEGLCGRTTVFEDPNWGGRNGMNDLPDILVYHQPLDGAILMLGTNDCKTNLAASAHMIGKGIEQCLDEMEKYVPADKILLISPIHIMKDCWKPGKNPGFGRGSVEMSKKLKNVYKAIADRRGHAFLAASDFVTADENDCEHLDEAAHAVMAELVYRKLAEMGFYPTIG